MPSPVKPAYFTGVPTAQAAVDIFQGAWKSAFPPGAGVKAGIAPNFADRRVQWVASELGGLRHRSVLELGPYEGYITYQLDRLGAAPVVAVEGRTWTTRPNASICVGQPASSTTRSTR